MSYKVVSLFSGAGGMDVGMEKAGFEIIAASELDAHASNTYKHNHPSVSLVEGDIEDPTNFNKIISYEGVDLVVGGPPCQGFSVAGKMDKDDPRSKLVFTYCSKQRINGMDMSYSSDSELTIRNTVRNIKNDFKAAAEETKYFDRLFKSVFTRSRAELNEVAIQCLALEDVNVYII